MKIVPKILLMLLAVLIVCSSLVGCTKKTNSNVQVEEKNLSGKLTISIIDKSTKKPVSDAKIIILEVDNIYKTDDKGLSPEIALKVNKDTYKKYGDGLAKKSPSGSIDVLITKEGYKDYVLFNKAVYPGYSPNLLNVELTKLAKNDGEKYTIGFDYPHETWIEELVSYCNNIGDENSGSGGNQLSVTVKDQNSKAVEGALVYIPEQNIRATTGKDGKVTLKPESNKETSDIYPVKRELSEYTVVAVKEGMMPSVVFNAAVSDGKTGELNIAMKKENSSSQYVIKYQPFEKEWVEKLIDNYKQVRN